MSFHKLYPVFAYPVSDLTIARYLAAKGVDYIGILVPESGAEEALRLIHLFREWLEGPEIIAVCNGQHELCITLHDQVSGYYFLNGLTKPYSGFCFLPYSSQNEEPGPERICKPSEVSDLPATRWIELEVEDDPVQFKDFKGFVLHPGKESKTGWFDFEALDLWFERLEGIQNA